MKNLKNVLIILVLFGSLAAVHAQTTVNLYPKYGTVVTKVYKPKVIVHRGVNFHFSNGIWYKTRGRKYVVCAAPVGVKVRQLPRGNKVIVYNGRKLYKYKGVWYKKSGRGYIVVNV
ncbi:MAG: DUF6515 family protein [Bacteroidota bacterium]